MVAVLAFVGVSHGQSDLFDALRGGSIDDLKVLLAAGPDVHLRDERGATPLFWALNRRASPEVVRALVAAGADVNARGAEGGTPLTYAVYHHAATPVFAALLAGGADPGALDHLGAPMLHLAAAHHRDPDVIRALVAAGAGVKEPTAFGTTALMTAVAFVVQEFFVLHAYRGAPTVERAAGHGFDLHRGRWEVVTYPTHHQGIAFWRRVIGRYTSTRFRRLRGG